MTPVNITEVFPFDACKTCEVCKPYLKKEDPDFIPYEKANSGQLCYILTCSHVDACKQFAEYSEED